MKKTKYGSILRKIVLLPLLILVPLNLLTITVSVVNMTNAGRRQIEQYQGTLSRTLYQIESTMGTVDALFDDFITGNTYHRRLAKLQPQEENQIARTLPHVYTWLKSNVALFSDVDGMFIYYPEIDLLAHRSTTSFTTEVRAYLEQQLEGDSPAATGEWQLAAVGDGYLVKLRQYQGSYYGVWVSLPVLFANWQLNEIAGEDLVLTTVQGPNGGEQAAYYHGATGLVVGAAPAGTGWIAANTGTDGIQLAFRPQSGSYWGGIPFWGRVIFAISLVAMLATPAIVYWLWLRIVKPLKLLDDAMQRIGSGAVEYRIEERSPKTPNEFDRLIKHFNSMVTNLVLLEENLYESKLQYQRIKLDYITRQIRPHFILNALNLIYSYEPEEYKKVRTMVLYLSEYFRYIVNLQEDTVPLGKEMQHTRRYLEIQGERYPGRFGFTVEQESATEDVLIPPLIIQSFVENSIKYSLVEDRACFIFVLARQEAGQLVLTIGDTGNGIPPHLLDTINSFLDTREPQKELGLGIQNSVERLDMIFGGKTDVAFRNAQEGGAIITIKLPLRRD